MRTHTCALAVSFLAATAVAFGISLDERTVPSRPIQLASSMAWTGVDDPNKDQAVEHSAQRDRVLTVRDLRRFQLNLPDWKEIKRDEETIMWEGPCGDVLSLSVPPNSPCREVAARETTRVRNIGRALAESKQGGLVEARVVAGTVPSTMWLVYKRLQKPAFVYTGMLIACNQRSTVYWCVVAGESGTTGVREAVITTDLLNEGKLTIEQYKSSWAQDPYEPGYAGVERATLRYMSDDEQYDRQFPNHPLSRVRRLLKQLLGAESFDDTAPCDSVGNR